MAGGDGDPVRVRLYVVADYDVGFPLTNSPPLPRVDPGESYVTECSPQRAISFNEIFVEMFSLVKISLNEHPVAATLINNQNPRLFHLDEPLIVGSNDTLHLHRCNATTTARKPKTVTLVGTP
jgi:hypothetical protein